MVEIQSAGVKRLVIRIQFAHIREVSAANANDDNRQWQVRSCHDLIDCLLHVHDHAVGEDQEESVGLVLLVGLHLLLVAIAIDEVQNVLEICRAMQNNLS